MSKALPAMKTVGRSVVLGVLISTAVLLLLPNGALAPPPPGYYSTVDTTSAVTLRTTLHEVIDDHVFVPYSSSSTDTWDVLEQADEDPNNSANILDVYKNASYPKYGAGNPDYHREHTWPKSYGFPEDGTVDSPASVNSNYPYTDCHHLFLCNGSYNISRSNKPYRYCAAAGCTEKPTDVNNGQGGGSGTYPGNSNWTKGSYTAGTWETWIRRQGDVARALFYLDVRYEGGTHGLHGASEPDLILTDSETQIANCKTGSNESVAYMGMKSVLLQWHVEDPVDDVERARNDAVFAHQGNRNPFIDHPEWVACIFSGTGCGGDTAPPVFGSCPASIELGAENSAGLPLSASAWTTFFNSLSSSVTDDVDPSPGVTHDAPDPLPIAVATNVTFTTTDAAGNSSTCEVTVHVYRPADIVMVLDDTGSMKEPTGDGTGKSKIESLRSSAGVFTAILDQFRRELGDQLGAITFKVPPGDTWTAACQSTWHQPLVSFGPLDSKLGELDTVMGSSAYLLADGWATPIRAGVEAGSDLLNAQPSWRRRLMVLLTDGMQNTDNCMIGPDVAGITSFKQSWVTDRDIGVLAIGFGAASQIDAGLLGELAYSPDGFYDTADSTQALNKWFAQVLSVILQQSIVLDPQGSIGPGATADPIAASLTSAARSVTFLLTWAREEAHLDLTLRTPGPDPVTIKFSDYVQPRDNITALTGSTYRAIIARFPLGGELEGKHAGVWKALLSRSSADPGSEEPYTFMVLADSSLRMHPLLPERRLATGNRLPLLLGLSGTRLAEIKVTAEISIPRQGLGARLAAAKLTDEAVKTQTANLTRDYDMLARRISLLRRHRPEPVARDARTIVLHDDGKHGDLRPHDGVFGGVFGLLPVDGTYSVVYRAVGITAAGERFHREFRRGLYVPLKLSPSKTTVRVTPPAVTGKVFPIVVIPRDDNGHLLGPGYAKALAVQVDGATTSAVLDRGDGSYTLQLTMAAGAHSAQADLTIGGAPLRSVLLVGVPSAGVRGQEPASAP